MATHEQCPGYESMSDEELYNLPLIGTSLFAVRCKMIEKKACKGDGITPTTLREYCKGCSEYYGICELCGEPIVVDC